MYTGNSIEYNQEELHQMNLEKELNQRGPMLKQYYSIKPFQCCVCNNKVLPGKYFINPKKYECVRVCAECFSNNNEKTIKIKMNAAERKLTLFLKGELK